MMITRAQVEHFVEQGWLLTDVLAPADLARVRQHVDEVAQWDDGGGDWLPYREMTDDGPKLCRTENFSPFHAGLAEFLTAGPMLATASALLGETAVLYKEKINFGSTRARRIAAARTARTVIGARCSPRTMPWPRATSARPTTNRSCASSPGRPAVVTECKCR